MRRYARTWVLSTIVLLHWVNIETRLALHLSGKCLHGLESSNGNDMSSICTPRAVRFGFNQRLQLSKGFTTTGGLHFHCKSFTDNGGIATGQVSIGSRAHSTNSIACGRRQGVYSGFMNRYRIHGLQQRHINP